MSMKSAALVALGLIASGVIAALRSAARKRVERTQHEAEISNWESEGGSPIARRQDAA